MIGVDNIKFDTPLKQEYRRQSKEKSKQWCRHLKGIEYVKKLDSANDEIYEIPCCKLCGKELNELDLYNINKTLKKYVKQTKHNSFRRLSRN